MTTLTGHFLHLDDARWAVRAAADVLLRQVLVQLIRDAQDYPGLAQQLASARYIRTPVGGKVAVRAEEQQNQATDRTSQRAHAAYRELIMPALRFEVFTTLQTFEAVEGRGFELNQHEVQHFLELAGWNLSQITRNQVLFGLLQEGFVTARRDRDKTWYRLAASPQPLPAVDVWTGQLSRWLGSLTATCVQRLRSLPSAQVAELPAFPHEYMTEYVARVDAFACELLQKYAVRRADQQRTLSTGQHGSESMDLVWLRYSMAAGPVLQTVPPVQQLPDFATVLLAGDLGQLIGDVYQADAALRRYLSDFLYQRAQELGVEVGKFSAQACNITSLRTLKRWSEGPLLLEEDGRTHYSGGSIGPLLNEAIAVLQQRWPSPVPESTLKHLLQKAQSNRRVSDELLQLVWAHLASDARVRCIPEGRERPSYTLRAQFMTLHNNSGAQQYSWLEDIMCPVLELIQSQRDGMTEFVPCSIQVPVRWMDVDEILEALKTQRDGVRNELQNRLNSCFTPEQVVNVSSIFRLFTQTCISPFYPERIWHR